MNQKSIMVETKIYVGLNDADSHEQKYDTEKYINIMKDVCRSYHIPFSFTVSQGGYIHENGEYVQETALVISLIDVKNEVINEVARDLCAFFQQESVLITEEQVRSYYVKEHLNKPEARAGSGLGK